MNMRLLGAPNLEDVVPSMVDASNIHTHIVSVPGDNLYNNNCENSAPPPPPPNQCIVCADEIAQSDFADENLPHARLLKSKM
jgi:hypothetical protein